MRKCTDDQWRELIQLYTQESAFVALHQPKYGPKTKQLDMIELQVQQAYFIEVLTKKHSHFLQVAINNELQQNQQ